MALTLAQSALYSQNQLQRGVMETFVQESSVFDRIELEPILGNAYAYNEEGTLPGIEFRAVNAAYAESTGTINQKTESLVILGGDADVDTFLVATRGNLIDLRASQTGLKVKAASIKYQDAFINGDVAVDANSFDGLKKRLIGVQVIDGGGLSINGDTDELRQDFFDLLDELLGLVPGANAAYMNTKTRAKIMSAMRRLNINVERVGDKKDPVYNGVPLLDIGNRGDGSPIIPATAGNNDIYAVRFGTTPEDGGVIGLTNGGVQVEDLGKLQAKPAWRTRIEFFCGLGVFSGKGAARLRNLG